MCQRAVNDCYVIKLCDGLIWNSLPFEFRNAIYWLSLLGFGARSTLSHVYTLCDGDCCNAVFASFKYSLLHKLNTNHLIVAQISWKICRTSSLSIKWIIIILNEIIDNLTEIIRTVLLNARVANHFSIKNVTDCEYRNVQ